MTLYIICTLVLLLLVMTPILTNAIRDYNNLHEGSRAYVRIRDDVENSPYNYRGVIVVMDRPLGKKESLAYSDGLILHNFGFWDILTMKIITEERFDDIFG